MLDIKYYQSAGEKESNSSFNFTMLDIKGDKIVKGEVDFEGFNFTMLDIKDCKHGILTYNKKVLILLC